MFSKLIKTILVMFVIAFGVLMLNDDIRSDFVENVFGSGIFNRVSNLNINLKEVQKDIKEIAENLPTPLISKKTSSEGNLDPAKIVAETNFERANNGLSPLTVNSKLTLAARNKVDDMFANQYFEHDSPAGKGPSDLADAVQYEYLTIGENLALGIFKDEKDLVTAWMNSPGHRANILGKNFIEIGVSAKRGIYKGETVWMSVQEFGKPLSVCPKPDESLKIQIESESRYADEFSENLENLRREIKNMPKNNDEYNKLVESYNKLVNDYNDLITKLKNQNEEYNAKINLFNECLSGNT